MSLEQLMMALEDLSALEVLEVLELQETVGLLEALADYENYIEDNAEMIERNLIVNSVI